MDYFGPRLVDKASVITEDVSYRRRSRANSLADYDETTPVTSTALSVFNPSVLQEQEETPPEVIVRCGVILHPIITSQTFGSTDSEGSFNSFSSHNGSFRSTPGARSNRSPHSPVNSGRHKTATPPLSPHTEIALRMSYFRQQAVKYSYWASTPPSTPRASQETQVLTPPRRRFSEAVMVPPSIGTGHHRVRSISSSAGDTTLDFASLLRGSCDPHDSKGTPRGRGDGILFSAEYLKEVQREGYEIASPLLVEATVVVE